MFNKKLIFAHEKSSNRMNRDKLQFVATDVAEAAESGLKELYFAAFPPEERRPWADFAKSADNLTFLKIIRNGSIAGMATIWRFDKMSYLEHFAIFPDMRCGGVGSEALRCLRMLEAPKPLVLEAERPEAGEMARRRIGFYLRNGFSILHGIDYIQPLTHRDFRPCLSC